MKARVTLMGIATVLLLFAIIDSRQHLGALDWTALAGMGACLFAAFA